MTDLGKVAACNITLSVVFYPSWMWLSHIVTSILMLFSLGGWVLIISCWSKLTVLFPSWMNLCIIENSCYSHNGKFCLKLKLLIQNHKLYRQYWSFSFVSLCRYRVTAVQIIKKPHGTHKFPQLFHWFVIIFNIWSFFFWSFSLEHIYGATSDKITGV